MNKNKNWEETEDIDMFSPIFPRENKIENKIENKRENVNKLEEVIKNYFQTCEKVVNLLENHTNGIYKCINVLSMVQQRIKNINNGDETLKKECCDIIRNIILELKKDSIYLEQCIFDLDDVLYHQKGNCDINNTENRDIE